MPSQTPNPSIRIAPHSLFQSARTIGEIAHKTYLNSALSEFITPYRHQYPQDSINSYVTRYQAKLLSPSNFIFCAYLPSSSTPNKIVGFIIFERLGDDVGAQKAIERYSLFSRLILGISSWVYSIYVSIFCRKNRAENPEAMQAFKFWQQRDRGRYWDPLKFPERQNRYHVRSLLVLEDYGRRGIGGLLLEECLERARDEGVCVGLESSRIGEGLYRKKGFELLGRFEGNADFEETKGGVMIWWPEGRGGEECGEVVDGVKDK